MAKKKTEPKKEFDLNEAQKRMNDYVDACEKAKKGKITALSMIGVTVLCLLILLIVCLKLSGVGFTVIADGSSDNVTIVQSGEVDGTKLADVVNAN